MDIKKLQKIWVQESFYHPYPAYKSDLETEDGLVLVFPSDLQSMEPDKIPQEAIYASEEEANASFNQKLQKANGLKKFICDFFISGPENSWIRQKFMLNRYDSYYETRIATLERILTAYRTNMLNIDGTSIRIDQVDTVRFTGDFTDTNMAGTLTVIFGMKSGNLVTAKLHIPSDKKLFNEFFGNNASGYHLEGITPEQVKEMVKS